MEHQDRFSLNIFETKEIYWTKLPEDEREKCRGPPSPIKYGRKVAWYPAGCLQQYWVDKLERKVKDLWNNEKNKAQIYKNYPGIPPLSSELYLLGNEDAPYAAKPVVLIVCSSNTIATRAAHLLSRHEEIKKLKLGFEFIAYKEDTPIR